MVTDIINQVRNDNSNRHVAITTEEDLGAKSKGQGAKKKTPSNAPAGFQPQKKKTSKKATSQPQDLEVIKASHNPDEVIGMPCPACKEGHIIKGRTAYGCSRWKEGCTYRLPFDQA
jgi:DNA topoisomerase-3